MNTFERLLVGAIGALLLGLGLYVLFIGEALVSGWFVGSVALCALGGNAIYGALIGKRPWISGIGPLP